MRNAARTGLLRRPEDVLVWVMLLVGANLFLAMAAAALRTALPP